MRVFIKNVPIAFFITIITLSCDQQRVYEYDYDLKDKIWVFDSTKTFEFQIEDTSSRYNLIYKIRNTSAYDYYNLHIKYYLDNQKGITLSTDLQNLNLFDPITGDPKQPSVIGDVFGQSFYALKDYKFNNSGTYYFNAQHFMRIDTLNEILSIGLRVEKAAQ